MHHSPAICYTIWIYQYPECCFCTCLCRYHQQPSTLHRGIRIHYTCTRRTTKHILKSARRACGKRCAKLLRHCIIEPQNLQIWEKLLTFGRDVLTQPEREGKRHNLTSITKKRTAEPCLMYFSLYLQAYIVGLCKSSCACQLIVINENDDDNDLP